MGTDVIERAMVDELQRVAADILSVAVDHRKCLACHCYREVAEEAVGTLDLLSVTASLRMQRCPPISSRRRDRLRYLLDSADGTHG